MDCMAVVYLPFLVLHRGTNTPVTITNLRALVMEGEEEELVLSQNFLTSMLKINIQEIFEKHRYPDEIDAGELDSRLMGDNVVEEKHDGDLQA